MSDRVLRAYQKSLIYEMKYTRKRKLLLPIVASERSRIKILIIDSHIVFIIFITISLYMIASIIPISEGVSRQCI